MSGIDALEQFMVFHVYDDKVMLKLVVSVAEVLGKIQVLPLLMRCLSPYLFNVNLSFHLP